MKSRYLKKEILFADLNQEKHDLVYLTGKTSIGKTFMAHELSVFGYQSIQLDEIVIKSVFDKFHPTDWASAFTVYKENAPVEWTDSFVEVARQQIVSECQIGPVIVEGALANNSAIKSIFCGELKKFIFIFLLPVNIAVYADQILQRFISEAKSNQLYREPNLPKEFFQIVEESSIQEYLDANTISPILRDQITVFARWSMEESLKRLKYFETEFDGIVVLEV